MPQLFCLVAVLALSITGCGGPDYAHRRVDGDTVIFTDHWSSHILPFLFGLVFLGFGLMPCIGHLKRKFQKHGRREHKRRERPTLRSIGSWAGHAVFAVGGIGILLFTFVSAERHYVAVNQQRYYSHWDIFGRESTSVDLAEVTAMHVTKVRVAGRRRRIRTKVLFVHKDGERQSDLIMSGAERAAVEYLIEKAPDWGFEVDDRRDKE